jgi:hypothetical protein
MAVAEHLIAHTRGGARSLLEQVQASWIWTRLRAGFPDALSCVLMPDHIHLVAPPGGRTRFVRVLAMFSARFGVRFDSIAETANTAEIAARMIRYGFHNPVRDALVADPYAWQWSTLRDLVGAAHPIWTPLQRVAAALQLRAERVLRLVTHAADLRPQRPELTTVIAVSMDALRDATSAALRIDAPSQHRLGRRLIVQAACTIGRPTTARLATELSCCDRTIERARVRPDPALSAVLLCLADARLRRAAAPRR